MSTAIPSVDDTSIPIDVFGVKEVGIESWQRQFHWPIPPELFPEICRELLRHFLAVATSSGDEHRHVMLASFKAQLPFFQWLHMLLLQRRAEGGGRELLLTEETQFTRLLDRGAARSRPRVEGQPLTRPATLATMRSWAWFGREQLRSRSLRGFLQGSRGSESCLAFPGQHRLGREYCLEREIHPVLVPVELFLGRPKEDPSPRWRDTVRSLVDGYLAITERYCGPLSSGQREIATGYFDDSMSDYRATFNGITGRLRRVPRLETMRFLSSSLGSPIHKVVSQAFRLLGGHLIGVSHSNAFGRPNTFNVCLNELAMCDEYVVGSSAEKKVFEFCIDHYKQTMPELPDIPHSRVTTVRNHYTFRRSVPADDRELRIRSVMVIGAPYVPFQNYQLPGANGIRWLALELDVVRRLKKAGFTVYYKAHPDRLQECRDIFEGRVDAMIGGRTEDAWGEADCVLNTTWGATSFSMALLAGKPSILIDTLGAPWPPHVRPVIEKRCLIVGTVIDTSNNSIHLDDGDFGRCVETLRHPSRVAQQLRESESEFLELLT
jgi:hypothetical protein